MSVKIVFIGKFQMMVLAQSGHAVHEDHPDKVEFDAFILQFVSIGICRIQETFKDTSFQQTVMPALAPLNLWTLRHFTNLVLL